MKIIILILLFTCKTFGQQTKYDKYDLYINNANSLKKENRFKEAITEYRKGLNSLDKHLTSTPFFDLAACAIKTGNYNLAKKYISLGVVN